MLIGVLPPASLRVRLLAHCWAPDFFMFCHTAHWLLLLQASLLLRQFVSSCLSIPAFALF